MKRYALALLLLGCLWVRSPCLEAATASERATSLARTAGKQPTAERQIEIAERQTLDTRAQARDRNRRRGRVATQIPAALRERVARKIEARITRNVQSARRLRRRALGMLRGLLEDLPPGAAELPTTLMRLGELEWEESRERFLADFAAWENGPVDERGEPPLPRYAGPRARFNRVISDHPSFERYDLALYVDGFLASEEGKGEEAVERFDRIVDEFPRSDFVPDAHMVRAEVEFARELPDFERALREYEAVLAYPESEIYDLALFKSAWALWRLGRSEAAARRFLKVFKKTAHRKAREQQSPSRASGGRARELDQLQHEALENLVQVFVEDENNSAKDLHGFLVEAGGDRFAGQIVRALAEALYERAHYLRGVEAYRLLLLLDPLDPSAYEHGLAIAMGHSTMEAWGELAADYGWLLAEYVDESEATHPTTRGAWAGEQDADTRAAARAAIERALYEDALGLHAKAQADQSSRAEFEAASQLYGVYIDRFAGEPHAYEAFFNRGEINFHHLGNASLAAQSYLAAVRLRPDGPWSRGALHNTLIALEEQREKEFRAAREADEAPTETPTDRQLTESLELYSATYPEDPKLPELLFRQGRLYYDYGVYDPAVRLWGLLLERHPQATFARGAGELILDSFNRSSDYENIEAWGRRLLTAPAFADAKGQAQLGGLIVQAIFKLGEALSSEEAHGEAAEAYLRAARDFPRQERGAQAAVNACQAAQRAVDLERMKLATALLMERYVAREESAQGIWIAADTYQSIGLLGDAAQHHEALAEHWPRSKHHADAAFNAVLLRTTLGQREQAIGAGKAFQRRYPRGERTDEVTFLMGKAHEQSEDWRAAESLYARYSRASRRASRRIEALVRLAVARVELADEPGARTALQRAVRQRQKYRSSLDERGKYFGARAQFLLAQRVLAEFEKIRIEGDPEQLGRRLKSKAKLLKKATGALLATAKLGVAEWTTAALYQVGFMYESFAQSLMNSPPPSDLTEEQIEEYRMQIDTFVIPIEEKSIEAYESGWLKAVDLGIYNAWTAKMRAALGRLNGEMYPPISEIGFRLRSDGASRLPPLIRGPRRTQSGQSRDFLMQTPQPDEPVSAGSEPVSTLPHRQSFIARGRAR